jgi:plastocyanin
MEIDRHVIRTVGALGVGIALTLAACGGSDDDDEATTSTAAVAATTQPAVETDSAASTGPASDDGADDGSAGAAGDGIVIADFTFTGVTEVQVGETLVVTNADAARHTFTAVDGTFDSGPLSTGDTFEFMFTEPGEFDFFCNFHPSMTGTIVVTG